MIQMSHLRGVSSNRVAQMRTGLQVLRAGGTGIFPACAQTKDRCARRWILFTGDYWPTASGSVNSDQDARIATRALQRDLGVTDDGAWGPATHRALERSLGESFPEGVPPGGWPSGGAAIGAGASAPAPIRTASVFMAVGVVGALGAIVTAGIYLIRKHMRRRRG